MDLHQFSFNESEFDQAHRTAYLISTYIQKKLTTAEREELDEWVGASKENLLLFEELTDDKELNKTLRWFQKLDIEKAKRRVHQKMNIEPVYPFWKKMVPYMVAASLLIAVFSWYYLQKQPAPNIIQNPQQVEPFYGGNKAVLTLSNGRKILLDSAANGSLANEGASIITKSDSILSYGKAQVLADQPLAYNVISTPRGSSYKIILSDGTIVWLNAASSLRFPVAFGGNERSVELTGEGYFEVAKNKEMPFFVKALQANIRVLGTHFNVKAYAHGSMISATLLEGSVEVSNNSNKVKLRPGEQAQMQNQGSENITVSNDTDIESVTAWKNGEFNFRNESLTDIMQTLKNWYDIEVIYKADIKKHLTGTFYRSEPLSKILRYLEGTSEVHFRVTGKTITVLP